LRTQIGERIVKLKQCGKGVQKDVITHFSFYPVHETSHCHSNGERKTFGLHLASEIWKSAQIRDIVEQALVKGEIAAAK
jgi:hypothetical protein